LPFWLAQVADDYLDNRLILPSRQEVISACLYLISAGHTVSPQALGCLLGISKDGAKAAYKQWQASTS
jgi:hypothetical protein